MDSWTLGPGNATRILSAARGLQKPGGRCGGEESNHLASVLFLSVVFQEFGE